MVSSSCEALKFATRHSADEDVKRKVSFLSVEPGERSNL